MKMDSTHFYASFLTVYLYDSATGIYLEPYAAQLSPVDDPGTYIMPVCATPSAPPVAAENQIAVFAKGVWELKPDYRGKIIYNQEDNTQQVVSEIGEIPYGYAFTQTLAAQLEKARATQKNLLVLAYKKEVEKPVKYTSKIGGTYSYDADAASVNNLANMIASYSSAQKVPEGFYWIAADNIQVSFTFADLLGLAAAFGEQHWNSFSKLQAKKKEVLFATTVVEVQKITF